MTFAQFLVDDLPTGAAVVLDGDEGRHAVVKRLSRGELVLVGDGRGTVLTCVVDDVHRDRVELTVQSRNTIGRAEPTLVVVQALPKGERADLAVELLTELGVDQIVPWESAHAVTRLDGDRAAKAQARWQRTAREATKQSRRAWMPVVAPVASTAEVATRLRAASTALVLDEAGELGIATVQLNSTGDVVVVVGPEGGISLAERDVFAAAGAVSLRLGEPVLRTSTAGGAALAALNLRLGRWR